MTGSKKISQQIVNMTEGSIAGHLIRFAIPLLLGNLFQQLYNTVDSWVVGNFVSTEAFSAVGTIGPVVNLMISFFSGLATGAGVVISQYYGAGNAKKVSSAVHASMQLVLALGVVMSAFGLLFSPVCLRLMKTPPEVFVEADIYLRIYSAGLISLVLYNMGAAILRAVGDTRRPFYYLVVCAVVNIVLDLLFVIRFRLGVAGVAYATVIAQIISMILILQALLREKSEIRLILPRLTVFDGSVMRSIIRIGMPSGLQMAVTSFSNMFVQSYINVFGTSVMGGWAAYQKFDRFIFLPVQSLVMAVTTFVGQNLGHGDVQRAKEGYRICLRITYALTAVLVAIAYAVAPWVVAFFDPEPEVVEAGTMMIRFAGPFFFFVMHMNICAGALRGAGDSRNVMIMVLLSFVVLRQIYLFIMANFISNTLKPIFFSYPMGWIAAAIIVGIYFRKNADRLFESAAAEAGR